MRQAIRIASFLAATALAAPALADVDRNTVPDQSSVATPVKGSVPEDGVTAGAGSAEPILARPAVAGVARDATRDRDRDERDRDAATRSHDEWLKDIWAARP